MGQPGGLLSMGWHRVGHDWSDLAAVIVTYDSPWDSKEIKPVHPKENQPWIVIGRTDFSLKLKLQYRCEVLMDWKRPWCWERLKVGGEGDYRGWDCWMASPTQRTWVWVNSGSWWWTGRPACCSPWGCKESDTTERQNCIELRPSPLRAPICRLCLGEVSLLPRWLVEKYPKIQFLNHIVNFISFQISKSHSKSFY